ncbi:uncharacterized protein [Dermacentor andersoni]|uniref:uncharacterized protein n=1 Tax=Dermacentor andersoni TaxID=34620 RepID=UPI0024171524|nr:uncharacterized protein LOC129386742 [Dermacentor andersoni]
MQGIMKLSVFVAHILIAASVVAGQNGYEYEDEEQVECPIRSGRSQNGSEYQDEEQVECPIRSGRNGCVVYGKNIAPGKSLSLEDPCINVECSANGRRLTVEGCSESGNICPGGPVAKGKKSLKWPFCCARCHTPDISA